MNITSFCIPLATSYFTLEEVNYSKATLSKNLPWKTKAKKKFNLPCNNMFTCLLNQKRQIGCNTFNCAFIAHSSFEHTPRVQEQINLLQSLPFYVILKLDIFLGQSISKTVDLVDCYVVVVSRYQRWSKKGQLDIVMVIITGKAKAMAKATMTVTARPNYSIP